MWVRINAKREREREKGNSLIKNKSEINDQLVHSVFIVIFSPAKSPLDNYFLYRKPRREKRKDRFLFLLSPFFIYLSRV